ncbi:tannase and feruloyl esterase [Rhizodiscina lignyota]|uniref:Carboxylic ester hydrolase n=1 Tax=Rhizodiscina lignyota TaxID=1504668 RepID=A0A9P4IAZ2_9PEZI|nr:tannase and feruloyl esterase [Rhizodiscina lignyota]
MKLLGILMAGLIASVNGFDCSASFFAKYVNSSAKVTSAETLPAGSTYHVPASDLGFPDSPTNLPALCVVHVEVTPVPSAPYNFAIFLPHDWNGRTVTVGGWEFAGGIPYADIGVGVRYGFASIGTDFGHLSIPSDGRWAYHQPEKASNWGWRAVHGSATMGKDLVEAFYGKKVSYRYFSGCSTGGRHGFKSAQMFPDDFDGILAGAPAWWEDRLAIQHGWMSIENLPIDAPHHMSAAMYPVIGAEAVRQCDPQDGLKDGIISDPFRCDFRLEALLCGPDVKNSTASKCLTSAQLTTLYKWYNNWVEKNQTFIFPHFEFGSEAQWSGTIPDTAPSSLMLNWMQYMIGLGPDWDWQKDWNTDLVFYSERYNPGQCQADDFDMSPFYKTGAKILQYHGYADGLIPTRSSVYLYEHIYRTLYPKGIDLDNFYRMFFVPGMQHCFGTPPNQNAPWYFAGARQANSLSDSLHSVPGYSDPKHDVLLALVDWVENGKAPTEIIATKWHNDTLQDSVTRQRPLCMYPKQAKYKGSGDPDKPENWECKGLY